MTIAILRCFTEVTRSLVFLKMSFESKYAIQDCRRPTLLSERMEIKDLLAYLRLLVNPTDDFSFRRVVNSPKRGIGNKSIDKLALFAEMHSFSLLEAAGSPLNGISGKAGKA